MKKNLGVTYGEDFVPRETTDTAWTEGTLHVEGMYLFHELTYPALCWCDPEITGWSDEHDDYIYTHRRLQ